MTPIGNNNAIPVGVFYDKERGYFYGCKLSDNINFRIASKKDI